MWFVLLFALAAVDAHSCCSTCACQQRCERPAIGAQVNMHGLDVTCHDSECACVVDELDTCTTGPTWTGRTHIAWNDTRWHECIKVEHERPFMARALVRWWHGPCIGHSILELEIDVETITRDLFVDFNVLAYFEHDVIHNVFRIKTQSGSDDQRPTAGASEMFFEAELLDDHTGVHVEITNCTVQIIEGKAVTAPIMREINVFDANRIEAAGPGGSKMTYDAFWDYETNSPYQRLVCSYALFNGTSSVLHSTVNRTYMMANPDETGIRVDDVDDVIVNGPLSN